MRRMARGEGKLGCILWGVLIVVVGFTAIKVVPIQFAKMKLEDRMREMALTQPRKSAQFFEKEIFNYAQELDLPVDKKKIKVRKTQKRVVMDVEFTVVLDLMITEYEWDMKIHVDRDIFLM